MTQATTAIKERPILFSGAMVRAILEGRKTQTRRVVSPSHLRRLEQETIKYGVSDYDKNPYGKRGDRLWVRETWLHDCLPMFTNPLNKELFAQHEAFRPDEHVWHYRATDHPVIADSFTKAGKWRPSIFMPRIASRIMLEITNVRVQQVQDISEEDAIAEGIAPRAHDLCSHDVAVWPMTNCVVPPDAAIYDFAQLWDSINAKRGYSWESNPSVWGISFKVVQP